MRSGPPEHRSATGVVEPTLTSTTVTRMDVTSRSCGELVLLHPAGMEDLAGMPTSLDASGRFPTALQEVRVFFDELPSPIVRLGIAGRRTAQVRIEYRGATSDPLAIVVQ